MQISDCGCPTFIPSLIKPGFLTLTILAAIGCPPKSFAEAHGSPQCRNVFSAEISNGTKSGEWNNAVVVLDTNIILNDWEAIFHFRGATVVIPLTVVGELDHKKKQEGAIGYNARAFARYLSEVQEGGRSLRDGIDLGSGSRLLFSPLPTRSPLPLEFPLEVPDNQILAVTSFLKDKNPNRDVYMISEDMEVRAKADLLGLKTMGFRIPDPGPNHVKRNSHYEKWTMTAAQEREWGEQGAIPLPEVLQPTVLANEFVRLYRESEGAEGPGEFAIFKKETGQLQRLKVQSLKKSLPIQPKNEEQLLALELLMDDSIDIVSLSGKAGTGKTLLALSVALKKVLWTYNSEGRFEEVILARSEIPVGEDPGALPGTADMKILPYMDGYLDNLSVIGKAAYARNWSLRGLKTDPKAEEEPTGERQPKRRSNPGYRGTERVPLPMLDPALNNRGEEWWASSRNLDAFSLGILLSGKIKIQPISFVRGRTLPNRIIIIDEAQNLRTAQIKTLVTRAGQGTRVILIGDTRQVDQAYLNDENNGLTDLIARFRGDPIHGNMKLIRSERSRLAEAATRLYGDD